MALDKQGDRDGSLPQCRVDVEGPQNTWGRGPAGRQGWKSGLPEDLETQHQVTAMPVTVACEGHEVESAPPESEDPHLPFQGLAEPRAPTKVTERRKCQGPVAT